MILLAFFFPLAIYLLILGVINRRSRPLFVRGVWDGIGLLFAASGFLLFAGPAIFTSVRERWRLYWLLGQPGGPLSGAGGGWAFWVVLSILYFALIVGGAALLLWQRRHVTSIYNVETGLVEPCLSQICTETGLNPIRSGNLFLFGFSPGERGTIEAFPSPARSASKEWNSALTEQTVILEVDRFALMNHVTLRWDPAEAPLRSVIENQLSQRLAEASPRDSALGNWLLTLGSLLLAFEFAGSLLVVLISLFHR